MGATRIDKGRMEKPRAEVGVKESFMMKPVASRLK